MCALWGESLEKAGDVQTPIPPLLPVRPPNEEHGRVGSCFCFFFYPRFPFHTRARYHYILHHDIAMYIPHYIHIEEEYCTVRTFHLFVQRQRLECIRYGCYRSIKRKFLGIVSAEIFGTQKMTEDLYSTTKI